MPKSKKPLRVAATFGLVAAQTALLAAIAPAAAGESLRAERGRGVVASLQPEDRSPPPGVPITPVELKRTAAAWPPGPTQRASVSKPSPQTCSPQFSASIVSGGERSGRLGLIRMSAESLTDPPTVRYRWRLARGVVLCKYRIYLGSGPSLTVVEPTHRDARTGYYDAVLNSDPPRFARMVVWGRKTKHPR